MSSVHPPKRWVMMKSEVPAYFSFKPCDVKAAKFQR
jgi:hypothetical protein